MNTAALDKLIALMEGTVNAKSDVTCTQFMTVMYVIRHNGLTQKHLSEILGVTHGAVSHNIKKLGPDGTGCLYKDGKLIKAADHVIERVTELLS